MTASLIEQLTRKQQQLSQLQADMLATDDLDEKFIISSEMDRLLAEMGQVRTQLATHQLNEIKTLEQQIRGL